MQSLFAFHQGKEANYLLCKDEVERAFEPDLNSMEVQDKKELTRQRKEAIKLLDKVFEKNAPLANDDEKIVSVVKAALAHYEKAMRKDATAYKKSLSQDVEKIYRQYISVLMLAVSTADAAKGDKKFNHGNFINNEWIEAFQKMNSKRNHSG